MKKGLSKILVAVIAAAMILGILPIVAFAGDTEAAPWDGEACAEAFEAGTGTAEDPYVIKTAPQLAFLAKSVNEGEKYSGKFIVLEADINLGNKEWPICGISRTLKLEANINGKGHTISGLYVSKEYTNKNKIYFGGLIGVASNCVIENLNVTGTSVDSLTNTGAIVGSSDGNLRIYNCTSNMSEGITGRMVGGIIGCGKTTNDLEANDRIIGCANYGKVEGDFVGATDCHVGGIIGMASNAYVAFCANYGEVRNDCPGKSFNTTGGIIGCSGASSKGVLIYNCFNAGNIIAVNSVNMTSSQPESGGISGRVGHAQPSGGMISCVNIGTVVTYDKDGTTVIENSSGGIGGYTNTVIPIAGCYTTGSVVIPREKSGVSVKYANTAAVATITGDHFAKNAGDSLKNYLAYRLALDYTEDEIEAIGKYAVAKAGYSKDSNATDYLLDLVVTDAADKALAVLVYDDGKVSYASVENLCRALDLYLSSGAKYETAKATLDVAKTYVEETPPDTGDNGAIVIVSIMTVISLAGVAVTLSEINKRKLVK